ncbi:hypothetical protein, partial [Burkholderia sp. MSh2]
ASDWLDTFIFRLLNGDHSRNVLINNLRLGDGGGAAEIISRLVAMQGDVSDKIKERASFVLSKLN